MELSEIHYMTRGIEWKKRQKLIDKSKPHTRLFIYELGFFVF